MAAGLKSQAFILEGALEEKAKALISQVRKLRAGDTQGMLRDTESETLFLCSFAAPSREEVWL